MARRSTAVLSVRDAEWLRPSDAARHFGVSERTLARWAAGRRIGRSEVGRNVWYRRTDIAELIATHATPRQVVPISAEQARPADDWQSDDFWRKGAR